MEILLLVLPERRKGRFTDRKDPLESHSTYILWLSVFGSGCEQGICFHCFCLCLFFAGAFFCSQCESSWFGQWMPKYWLFFSWSGLATLPVLVIFPVSVINYDKISAGAAKGWQDLFLLMAHGFQSSLWRKACPVEFMLVGSTTSCWWKRKQKATLEIEPGLNSDILVPSDSLLLVRAQSQSFHHPQNCAMAGVQAADMSLQGTVHIHTTILSKF